MYDILLEQGERVVARIFLLRVRKGSHTGMAGPAEADLPVRAREVDCADIN